MDPNFPCSLYAENIFLRRMRISNIYRVIDVPLPTHRLASSALQALQVDIELSPLVQRTFSLPTFNEASASNWESNGVPVGASASHGHLAVLRTEYKATTNRMLRVAVNGFMESLGVVLGVMQELDADVLDEESAT
jgi:EKC/KEOPS complex subunit PCC1/LAGE3